jgi:hypothetical protein
MDIT